MLASVKILRIKALCGTSEDSKIPPASRGFMALSMRIKYLPRLDDKGSLYGAG
jgi:hypothetical protein